MADTEPDLLNENEDEAVVEDPFAVDDMSAPTTQTMPSADTLNENEDVTVVEDPFAVDDMSAPTAQTAQGSFSLEENGKMVEALKDPESDHGTTVEEEDESMTDYISAVFVEGPLGIKFDREGQISAIKRGTQADKVEGLMKMDLLVSVNGTNTRGMGLKKLSQTIQEAKRPAEFVFQRHKMWNRGENGLPSLDRDMLRAVFSHHDSDGSMSVDADEFAALMEEVHELRVKLEGKDLHPLTNARDHAQELIDAHDDNDDGRLDFVELETWLDQGLRMGEEERKAYAARGGYCPDSVRFVEDIAFALHLTTDREKELEAERRALEEEKARRAEEERQRKAEEERQRKAEEERQREAEEEKKRKAEEVEAKRRREEDEKDWTRLKSDHSFIVATFREGPLGMTISDDGDVVSIKTGTQAYDVKELMRDDHVVKIGSTDVSSMKKKQMLEVLKNTPRPTRIAFRRNRNLVRNPENHLPDYDEELLRHMFDEHDKTESGSLNNIEFAAMMMDCHELAVSFMGRDVSPLENARDHAQNLIDAHDDNGDGRIDFEELTSWLKTGMMMSLEQRQAYSARGGYCPDSVRFVEDVCHGLHLVKDEAAEKKDLGSTLFTSPSTDPNAWPTEESTMQVESYSNRPAVPKARILHKVFKDGPMGLKLSDQLQIVRIQRGTQADLFHDISKDDVLIAVNDHDVQGFTLQEALSEIKDAGRPVTLSFRCHEKFIRGKNGLPLYDTELLEQMLHTHASSRDGEAIKESLGTTEVAKFIRDVHGLAVTYMGKDPHPLHNLFDTARNLIEICDKDDNECIDYKELVTWINTMMKMSAEEREAYAKKDISHEDRVRFVEDIAFALHLVPDALDNSYEIFEIENRDTMQDKEGNGGANEDGNEENSTIEESGKNAESGGTAKKSPRIKRVTLGELLSPDADDGVDRSQVKLSKLIRRALIALGSSPAQKHLQLDRNLIIVALRALIDTRDTASRAAVIERTLSQTKWTANDTDTLEPLLSAENFDIDGLMCTEFAVIDRQRLATLCQMLELEDYVLTQDLISRANSLRSEYDRLRYLVELAEAVAQPRESDALASRGLLLIDKKRRNGLTSIVERMSLSIDADQATAIQDAVKTATTWAQLTEVLEAVIMSKPKEAIKEASTGLGLCFRNQPRVEALKEHIRCSPMLRAISPIVMENVVEKLSNIKSSKEMCELLLLVLSNFAEVMTNMVDSKNRANNSKASKLNVLEKEYTTSESSREERIRRQALAEEQERVNNIIGSSDMLGISAKMGSQKVESGTTSQTSSPLKASPAGSAGLNGKVKLPPKLEPLRSFMRNTVVSVLVRGLDLNLDRKMITDELRNFAVQLIEDKCVTIAGLAKVLLVLLHPRISYDEKFRALPSSGLAFRATDSDSISEGERRLLRAIIKQYCKKRWTVTDKEGALRAVDSASKKRDVIEILVVLLNQGAKGLGNGPRAPAVLPMLNSSPKIVSTEKWAKSSTSTAKRRITKSDRGDKASLVESSKKRLGSRKHAQEETGHPSPPPKPPERKMPSRRHPHGLSAIRSLEVRKRPMEGAPPRALGSYRGAPTLWKQKA